LDARKFMAKVAFSYELDEDSIIPILPWLQTLLSEAAAATLESAMINGDLTAVHQDSDTELVAKHANRAFAGLRFLGLAVASTKLDVAGAITAASVLTMLKKMKQYGVKKSDLALIVGASAEATLMGLAETITFDKFGPRATILTGSLASIFGIPIIPSGATREDTNASGVFDNVTTTKGTMILVNLSRWIMGSRREFMVEVDKDISTQTNIIVASFRKAFKAIEVPSATVPSVVTGYNITV